MDNEIISHHLLAKMPKIPHFPPNLLRVVEILAFPAVQLLDVAGPLQVFSTANELVTQKGKMLPYTLRVVAACGSIVTSSAGLELAVAALPSVNAALDTLIIAGGQGVYAAVGDQELVSWVQARAAQARRVASVCTGAFLLGAAGLLNGRRAATHWTQCAELARRFPKVRVETDRIFIRDGTIWSSAGVTAGIDLALALVEQDLGHALALEVARHLVVFFKRPGGQAQFSTALSLQAAEDRFGVLHNWINENLSSDLPLAVLALQAGMSERSFSRRYAEATGITPARAVERLRVEAARRMLSDTNLTMKRIAARCGFGSEETMHRSFLRLLSATPQEYRVRFGS